MYLVKNYEFFPTHSHTSLVQDPTIGCIIKYFLSLEKAILECFPSEHGHKPLQTVGANDYVIKHQSLLILNASFCHKK